MSDCFVNYMQLRESEAKEARFFTSHEHAFVMANATAVCPGTRIDWRTVEE